MNVALLALRTQMMDQRLINTVVNVKVLKRTHDQIASEKENDKNAT